MEVKAIVKQSKEDGSGCRKRDLSGSYSNPGHGVGTQGGRGDHRTGAGDRA